MNLIKKSLTTLLLLLTLSATCLAQEEEIKLDRRLGFGFSLLGPGQFASLDLSYFVTRNLNVEVGWGAPMSYGGIKFYFGSDIPQKNSYIGIQATYGEFVTSYGPGGSDEMDLGWGLYAPIGIPLAGGQGFSLNLEFGLWHHFVEPRTIVWLGLKFKGYL